MSSDHEEYHTGDYVGYGHPPKKHQFKKGQSGNPKGRPKGAKNTATLFGEELNTPITIKEQGKTKTIKKKEAMVKSTVNKAVKGDHRATAMILSIEEEQNLKETLRAKPGLTEAELAALEDEVAFNNQVLEARKRYQLNKDNPKDG